ncbi:MAG TPA: DUF4129 domain-containing protein [Humibacter sp.]|jgi:hypothetical protein|nr:DUF4129 domain-containing protein [Humibacter sp.]
MGSNEASGRRVALVVAVCVLGLIMIGGVLVAGPLRAGPPRWLPTKGDGIPPSAAPGPFQTQVPAAPSHTSTPPAQLQVWLIYALIAAVVLAGILVYLIRRMLRRSGTVTEARKAPVASASPAGPAARTDEPAAPIVAEGIERAIQLLDETREPHDAIVKAWLGLQDAATASGVRRRPAETPAEYTARIVSRFGADSQAADTLLALYQGVRFGSHPADETTVATARSCLTRLRESWNAEAKQ